MDPGMDRLERRSYKLLNGCLQRCPPLPCIQQMRRHPTPALGVILILTPAAADPPPLPFRRAAQFDR